MSMVVKGLYGLCCGSRPPGKRSKGYHGAGRKSVEEYKQSLFEDCSPGTQITRSSDGADGNADDSFRTSLVSQAFQEQFSVRSSLGSARSGAPSEADKAEKEKECEDAPESKQILKDLLAAAKKIEGPVQKYPKGGRGFFKSQSPQDRYIAVIPRDGETSRAGGSAKQELDHWKAGTLSYWENRTEFREKQVAKGNIPLLRIAKVHYAKDVQNGHGVIVKHKQGGEMCELILQFPNKMAAEEWSYTLWKFLSELRRFHGIK
mmetsp:Transcript_118592/g.221616  ORF Transcript_118592/g.221616 Transcript_118592/m.221616 type:complete len:261 (+) Transcript_118592:84-866(+)